MSDPLHDTKSTPDRRRGDRRRTIIAAPVQVASIVAGGDPPFDPAPFGFITPITLHGISFTRITFPSGGSSANRLSATVFPSTHTGDAPGLRSLVRNGNRSHERA